MHRFLLFLAALTAFSLPASAQRPPAELRCIYDGVDAATLARAGEKYFLRDDTPPTAPTLLTEAARTCRRRHGWDDATFMIAASYTLARVGTEFARPWFATRGLAPARIDEVYDSTPRAQRLVLHNPTLRRSMLALLAAAHADALMEWVTTYIVARRALEQAELDWAALPAS